MTKNTSLKIAVIRQRHQDLDDEVDTMNEKRFLTPSEKMRLKVLKVTRLKCKDTLNKLIRESRVSHEKEESTNE
tara:strand:- start:5697 stop:5918 length:222 start_codon:yes stop_codon:yes gene_type:complete